MKEAKYANIVSAWIAMHSAPHGSSVYAENFWAYEELNSLCAESPNECLALIASIINVDSSDIILANLAAGPLEDLLVKHGLRVVDDVVNFAKLNPVWGKMLGAVWKNDIDDSVWRKIKSVAAASW